MQNNIAPVNTNEYANAVYAVDSDSNLRTGPIESSTYLSKTATNLAQYLLNLTPPEAASKGWRTLAQYMLNRETGLNSMVLANVNMANHSTEFINKTGAAVLALQLHPQEPDNWDMLANIVQPDEFIPVNLQGVNCIYSGESLRKMATLLRQRSQSAQV